MKSTTVRLHPDRKAQLERLQAQWQRRYGQIPTQQDLLGEVLDYVTSHVEAFFREAGWRPLSSAEIVRIFDTVSVPDLGDPERSITEEIDEVVYGEGAFERKMGRR